MGTKINCMKKTPLHLISMKIPLALNANFFEIFWPKVRLRTRKPRNLTFLERETKKDHRRGTFVIAMKNSQK